MFTELGREMKILEKASLHGVSTCGGVMTEDGYHHVGELGYGKGPAVRQKKKRKERNGYNLKRLQCIHRLQSWEFTIPRDFTSLLVVKEEILIN